MADLKINELKTRISLKYDTLKNWQDNNPLLLAGEVAFVKVETNDPANKLHPPVMFKVGPGNFNDLSWGSALAADVYSWAKAANFEMTITEADATNDGKYVNGLVWDKTTHTMKPQMVAFDTVIGDATANSTNAPQTKAVKAYVDAKVQEAVTGGTAGLATETFVTNAIADLSKDGGAIKAVADDLAAHEGEFATFQTNNAKAISDAQAAAEGHADAAVKALADDAVAKNTAAIAILNGDGTVAGSVNKMVGDAKTELNGKIGNLTDLETSAASLTLVAAINEVLGIANSKATIADVEALEYATRTEAQGYANAKDTAIQAAQSKADEAFAVAQSKDANIIESVKVNGTALTVTGKAVDITVPTDDQIKTLAANEIGRLIDASGDAEVLTSIGALVDYVEENAADIAELVTSVGTANTNASNAVTTANGASTVAGEAKELAQTAVNTANDAKTAATEAQNSASASAATAGQHKADAEAAKQAAETAYTNALTAAGNATTAKQGAETAQGKAEAAQDAAEAAQAAAEAAKGAAESANTFASGAASSASSSAGAAAQSASRASAAQGKAEAAQAAAETAQSKAEAAQAAAEAAKSAAEASNTSATAIANTAKSTADDAKAAADAATEAVEGLHAIATSGNIADLEQATGTYVLFNCGSSSEVI